MAPNPKSRKRQEKRLPKIDGAPTPPAQLPRVTWDDSMVSPVWLGSEFEGQVYERQRRDDQTGQLVQFAIGLKIRPVDSDDEFVDVVRVDVAHGFVHVDRYSSDGRKSKDTDCVPQECVNDLDAAMNWAVDYIWDVSERMAAWA